MILRSRFSFIVSYQANNFRKRYTGSMQISDQSSHIHLNINAIECNRIIIIQQNGNLNPGSLRQYYSEYILFIIIICLTKNQELNFCISSSQRKHYFFIYIFCYSHCTWFSLDNVCRDNYCLGIALRTKVYPD